MNQLKDTEKVAIMRSTFPYVDEEPNSDRLFVRNVSDFISNNFSKIDGFDFRWTSLITSNPLLFEDIDYLRVKSFVNETITNQEIEAYKSGNLRELYATFDNMLVCNLQYYDRIISYCTMVFLQYVNVNDERYSKDLDSITLQLELTPTKIWCAALSGITSTSWELKYAWGIPMHAPIPESNKSVFEVNYARLYTISTFAKFMEYSAFRCNTSGFRQTFIADKTSNRKLSLVCSKFTKTSIAISDHQLDTLYKYYKELESVNDELYLVLMRALSDMFGGAKEQYGVYIYANEFYIHTSKFSMKVSKDENGKISKDYLANSYECFAAEEYLSQSIRSQIKWAKHTLPTEFKYDKDILRNLLLSMLVSDYRNIICIKRMNEFGMLSKVYFTGIFGNVYINEDLMLNNTVVYSSKKCLSKRNAASYLIERGYVLFGTIDDVYKVDSEINKQSLVNHYMNYCVPVVQHMSDVIALHQSNKNDIIDFVVSGNLNPNKIKNHRIKHTSLKSTKSFKHNELLKLNNINDKLSEKKSYWKAIE